MSTGKKRQREKNNDESYSNSDSIIEEDIEDEKLKNKPNYIPLPQKSNYRMRAHCNPLSHIASLKIKYPYSPECIDWSVIKFYYIFHRNIIHL